MPRKVNVSWNPPINVDGGEYEHISHYKIDHNFPASGSRLHTGVNLLPSASTNVVFHNVYPSTYYFSITVVSLNGSESLPYIEYYDLSEEENIGNSYHLTAPLNLPLGGQSITRWRKNSNRGRIKLTPTRTEWSLMAPHQSATKFTNDVTPNLTGTNLEAAGIQDVKNVVSVCSTVVTDFLANGPNNALTWSEDMHYLFFDADDSNDRLKLIKYKNDRVPFWYDTGSGEKLSIAGTTSSFVTSLTGAISLEAGTTKVHGYQTDFLTEVKNGDTLFITSGSAELVGKVSNVLSHNLLKLAQPFDATRNRRLQNFGRANLRPDLVNDTIIAAYAELNDGTHILHNYLTVDAEKKQPKAVQSTSSLIAAQWTFDTMVDNKIPKVGSDVGDLFLGTVTGSGTTIIEDSPSGNAIRFTGVSNVRLADDFASHNWTVNGKGNFSIWLRSDKTDGTGINDARILSRDGYWSLRIDQSASTNQTVELINEQTSSSLLAADIVSGDWYNIALVADKLKDNTYTYGLYVNGEVEDVYYPGNVVSILPSPGTATPGTYTNATRLAAKSDNTKNFVGSVTDLIFFNSPLGADRVRGLNAISGIATPSTSSTPVKIGSGSNKVVFDSSGITVGAETQPLAPFSVTTSGNITAKSGSIGGWTLSASSLHAGTKTTSGYASSGITLYSGGTLHSPQFYIDGTGAFFKGTITASSGNIAGWKMTGSSLYAGITDSTAANFTPSGFTGETGIILHNQGSIHSKSFFINSDGSSSFSGNISNATGTFNGDLLPQSIRSTSIEDGSITFEEVGTSTIKSHNIDPVGSIRMYEKSSGSVQAVGFAALDGADDEYRFYVGDYSSGAAPLKITKTGTLITEDAQIFKTDNSIYFDSSAGFTGSAVKELSEKLGTRTNNFSDTHTGAINTTDSTTFTTAKLTASTDVTTTLKVPVRQVAVTALKEHFANVNNPTKVDFNVPDLAGSDTTLTRASNIKKPNGEALGRPLQDGEVFRLNLTNAVADMALTSVTNAKNAVTNSSFVLPLAIDPVASTFISFKIDGTSAFAFTISSKNTTNLLMAAGENTSATPDTETLARNKTPSTIAPTTLIKEGDTGQATSIIQSSRTYNRTYTTPTVTQYQVKTLAKDVLTASSIYSTVGIVPGGAVDSQGYLTRSSKTTTEAAGNKFYHSTVAVGGSTDLIDQTVNRVLDISIPSNSEKFAIQSGGVATQSAAATSLKSLTLEGDLTVPDAFSINTGGTVTVQGDFVVTGTQTTASQADLTVSSKIVTLSACAPTAALIHESGIIVDRTQIGETDASILWHETGDNADEWSMYNRTASPVFRTTGDGALGSPVYKFASRNSGLFAASDGASGDKVSFSIDDGSSQHESFVDKDGIHSSKNLKLGVSGRVTSTAGEHLILQPPSNDEDIIFQSGGGTSIMSVDGGNNRVGIKTVTPKGSLHIFHGNSTVDLSSNMTGQDHLILEDDTAAGMTFATKSNGYARIAFADQNDNNAGLIEYAHGTNEMDFRAGGIIKATFAAGSTTFLDSSYGGGAPTFNGGVMDLYQFHTAPKSSYSSVEGSTLTFSTYRTDENIRVTRAGIRCGATNNRGTGYGFMDFMANQTVSDEDTGVSPLARFTAESGGNKFLFQDSPIQPNQAGTTTQIAPANAPSPAMADFQIHSRVIDDTRDYSFRISRSSCNVGKGVSIEMTAGGLAVSQITCRRNSADNGSGDIEIRPGTNSGPATLPTIHCNGQNQYVGIRNDDPKAAFQIESVGLDTTVSGQIIGTSIANLHTVATSNFISAKFLIQMEDITNNNHLVSEILCIYDPNTQTVHATEYGVIHTAATKGVTFTVDVSSGNIRLRVTCDQAANNGERSFTVYTTGLARQLT